MRTWTLIAALLAMAAVLLPGVAQAAPELLEPAVTDAPVPPAFALALAGIAGLIASRGPSV